jgi:hypothetical protein
VEPRTIVVRLTADGLGRARGEDGGCGRDSRRRACGRGRGRADGGRGRRVVVIVVVRVRGMVIVRVRGRGDGRRTGGAVRRDVVRLGLASAADARRRAPEVRQWRVRREEASRTRKRRPRRGSTVRALVYDPVAMLYTAVPAGCGCCMESRYRWSLRGSSTRCTYRRLRRAKPALPVGYVDMASTSGRTSSSATEGTWKRRCTRSLAKMSDGLEPVRVQLGCIWGQTGKRTSDSVTSRAKLLKVHARLIAAGWSCSTAPQMASAATKGRTVEASGERRMSLECTHDNGLRGCVGSPPVTCPAVLLAAANA